MDWSSVQGAGIGSSPPVTVLRVSGFQNGWMELLKVKELSTWRFSCHGNRNVIHSKFSLNF